MVQTAHNSSRSATEEAAREPFAKSQHLAWIAAVIISIAASGMYIWLSDWPIGTHADEVKKASFIFSGKQDFNHPILLLQLARIANFFLGYTDVEETLRLGRIISSLFGGLFVFATFVLGRIVLAWPTALAAAVAVAVVPLTVFHATFLKEDIYFAGPAILGVAGLLVLVMRPGIKPAVATGAAFGLAVSAKYVAILFLFFAVTVVLIASEEEIRSRLKHLGYVLGVAALVILGINAEALNEYDTLLVGLTFEVEHARIGHDILLPIWLTGGIMHLRESLWPGVGLPLLILGVAGLLTPIFDRTRRRALVIISVAAILWYLVHEASPLKPYPNFERYMLPEGPLLIVLGAAFLEGIVVRWSPRFTGLVASAALLFCAAPAAYSSYEIIYASAHDPRKVVPQILGALGPSTFFDPYVTYGIFSFRRPNPIRAPEIVVTSSFAYERYARHGADPLQFPEIRQRYDWYFNQVFNHPYLEISSGGPSFGFLNPVVRIVALDDDIDHLLAIGDAIIQTDPGIRISAGPS